MWNARLHRTASADDMYARIENDKASVPSCRRVTIPVARGKRLAMRNANVESARANGVEALKDQVRYEVEKSELTAAAVRSGDVVPDQSMRRVRVARRVVGVPESIREEVAPGCFRDPRRD